MALHFTGANKTMSEDIQSLYNRLPYEYMLHIKRQPKDVYYVRITHNDETVCALTHSDPIIAQEQAITFVVGKYKPLK